MIGLLIATLTSLLFIPLDQAQASGPDRNAARAAYSHIQKLAGTWRSTSTKGWTEESVIVLAGKGSAVVETSRFVDTPEDSMVTTFYLDGDRLMLTHYCEAGNQPRMVATEISTDGRRIRFTFLDATNLRSPDAGHMHEAELHLIDGDRMTSRWSWHQGGKEKWMEEITSQRKK
jgi:hypothetical protein